MSSVEDQTVLWLGEDEILVTAGRHVCQVSRESDALRLAHQILAGPKGRTVASAIAGYGDRTLDDLAVRLARQLELRSIRLVRTPVLARDLDAPTVTNLSELLDPLHPLFPIVPDGPVPATALTFLSFDVVDEDNAAPLSGVFWASADGSNKEGDVNALPMHFEPLQFTAQGIGGFADLVFDVREDRPGGDPTHPDGPIPDGPIPDGPIPGAPELPDTTLILSIVDEDGNRVAGDFSILQGGSSVAEGHVDGDVTIDVPDSRPASLEIVLLGGLPN